jgi:hypothetical protein
MRLARVVTLGAVAEATTVSLHAMFRPWTFVCMTCPAEAVVLIVAFVFPLFHPRRWLSTLAFVAVVPVYCVQM